MSNVNMATPAEGEGFNKRQNVVVQPLLTGKFNKTTFSDLVLQVCPINIHFWTCFV
jgi:hypothetical protein